MSWPASRNDSNPTYGRLRLDTGISLNVNFSNVFWRDDAWLDFEAFALKRAMKAFKSSALSADFLF